jgi:hypothetical protein
MTLVMDLLLLPSTVQEGVLTGWVRGGERGLRKAARDAEWRRIPSR